MFCTDEEKRILIEKAIMAREKAYSPYIKYRVGAALLTKERKIYTGACIATSDLGVSICAEKLAFGKAILDGYKEFVGIAIAGWREGDVPSPEYPCKTCIQVMKEFCNSDSFEIILIGNNTHTSISLSNLLRFLAKK